jgi:glyoxylase-like metal-dependent hydrolase (beta-lactamase superfamily II)
MKNSENQNLSSPKMKIQGSMLESSNKVKLDTLRPGLETRNIELKTLAFLFLSLFACNVNAQQNVITFEIGSFAVSLLSEGQGQGNSGILIGATGEMLEKCAPDGKFPIATNAFLVETKDKTILFDAGYGRNLFDNLQSLKKKVENIDVIILTHMHGDHIGGLLRDGKKSFPKATLYIPQPEYDYWMSDKAGNSANARKVIEIYKDKLQLFEPGTIEKPQELIKGVRSVAAYGHTPGHTGYLLESDDSKLLIWGDLTHAMAVQMPYPQIAVTYDVDPKMAIEYRRQILEYVAENKIQIAGMHIPFPAMGKVRKDKTGNGYDFELLCECEGR